MIKLIIGVLDNALVIGEYNVENKEVSYLFSMTTILFKNTFHYTIKPLIIPFCMTKSVNSNIDKFSYWVEVDLRIHSNLVAEYIKLKEDVVNPDISNIPPVQLH